MRKRSPTARRSWAGALLAAFGQSFPALLFALAVFGLPFWGTIWLTHEHAPTPVWLERVAWGAVAIVSLWWLNALAATTRALHHGPRVVARAVSSQSVVTRASSKGFHSTSMVAVYEYVAGGRTHTLKHGSPVPTGTSLELVLDPWNHGFALTADSVPMATPDEAPRRKRKRSRRR